MTVLDIGRLFGGTVGDINTNKSTKENPAEQMKATKSKLSSKIVSKLSGVKKSTKFGYFKLLVGWFLASNAQNSKRRRYYIFLNRNKADRTHP